MIAPCQTETGRLELLIHGADHIEQAPFLEGYPAVMTLFKVCIKGVLKASGAVKDHLLDVHSAFCQS